MTTALDRTAPRDLAAGLPARLSLTPKTTLAGQLDGAWWPYSRDLEAELPPLAAALEEPWGRITRVTVNPTRWPVVPHTVPVDGRRLHVGWFTEQDPDKLILLSYIMRPLGPPRHPARDRTRRRGPPDGRRSDPGQRPHRRRPDGQRSHIGRGIRDVQRGEATWEGEGGACMSPFGNPMDRSAFPLPGNGWR